jgi:hypothetical protein
MRAEILKLRNDPTANAVMAGAFTKANADYLATKLGRQPSEGELYIAHFLGAGGAARLISLAAASPNAKATDYFPHAANANSSIFYDRATGHARSLAQVRDVLTARYDVARNDAVRAAQAAGATVSPGTLSVAQATGAPLDLAAFAAPPAAAAPSSASAAPAKTAPAKTAAAVPDTAGMTGAFAAATPTPAAQAANQMFHGLFQDTDRTAPVAAVVSQLWTTPNALPDLPEGDGAAAQPPHRDLRNLFGDPGARS